jgi:2-phosphosulfolactate phosphatase
MHVEVAFLPRDATRVPQRVALVIDVMRATTTLVSFFERGARKVTLANDVLSARAARQQQPDSLLLGEVGGLPPTDFAYGNSPVALAKVDLGGHELIFSTTNGTRALVAVAEAVGVIAAHLRNRHGATAMAMELAQAKDADITIVCAGRAGGTQQGLDDLVCAGYLLEQLVAQSGGQVAAWQPDADFAASLPRTAMVDGIELDDSAWVELRVYRGVVQQPLQPRPEEIEAGFLAGSARQGLTRLGLADDVRFCAHIDTTSVVPRLLRPGEATPYPIAMIAT